MVWQAVLGHRIVRGHVREFFATNKLFKESCDTLNHFETKNINYFYILQKGPFENHSSVSTSPIQLLRHLQIKKGRLLYPRKHNTQQPCVKKTVLFVFAICSEGNSSKQKSMRITKQFQSTEFKEKLPIIRNLRLFNVVVGIKSI